MNQRARVMFFFASVLAFVEDGVAVGNMCKWVRGGVGWVAFHVFLSSSFVVVYTEKDGCSVGIINHRGGKKMGKKVRKKASVADMSHVSTCRTTRPVVASR